MNIIKKNNAITLIALVITIVVLLILAGVAIAILAGENGLLSRAAEARYETEKARIKELIQVAVLGGYNEDGKLNVALIKDNIIKSISGVSIDGDELPIGITKDNINFAIDENGNVIEPTDRTGIEIGDYIDYEPDVPTSTVYSHIILDTYSGSEDNTEDIVQDMLNWQVLRKYTDGSIDLIGSTTSQKIYFSGVRGYTNGVYLMHDICKTLYSRSGIEARSVNLKDFDYWLEQSEEGAEARDNYVNSYNIKYEDEMICSGINNKYPAFYKIQKSESEIGTLTKDGTCISEVNLSTKQTTYELDINNENYADGQKVFLSEFMPFWLASRRTSCYSGLAGFGLRSASKKIGGGVTFYSSGASLTQDAGLRPIIHLKSTTEIKKNSGTIDEPHEIISY